MTKTVIEMAREAGLATNSPYLIPCDHVMQGIERFAELVRADEREACASKVEVFARKWWSIHCASNKHADTTRKAHDDFCMLQAKIRARSNQ